MPQQIPGVRGYRKGEDRRIGQAESESIRLATVPENDLWFFTPLGETIYAHTSPVGVTLTQDVLRIGVLPDRVKTFTPQEVRINVDVAAASSYIEIALFHYKDRVFTQLPGTYVRIDSTTTGFKQVGLPGTYEIPPTMRLFYGIVAHGGSPVVEGYQGGTVSGLRVIRRRELLGHTGTFKPVYRLETLPFIAGDQDVPQFAYLSKEASLIL